jgi:hypothetical protein
MCCVHQKLSRQLVLFSKSTMPVFLPYVHGSCDEESILLLAGAVPPSPKVHLLSYYFFGSRYFAQDGPQWVLDPVSQAHTVSPCFLLKFHCPGIQQEHKKCPQKWEFFFLRFLLLYVMIDELRHQLRSNIYNSIPITMSNPKSTITEAYRTIRTNLQFASIANDIRLVLLTSAVPSDGKTLTVSDLAVVSVQAGRRALLIDTDLRKPQKHRRFQTSYIYGLSNLIIKENKHKRLHYCLKCLKSVPFDKRPNFSESF